MAWPAQWQCGRHWILALPWQTRRERVSVREASFRHPDLGVVVSSGAPEGEAEILDLKEHQRPLPRPRIFAAAWCAKISSRIMSKLTISLSREDLEALIRRVVREELVLLPTAPGRSILDDSGHEGPEDPAQDALLLCEALELLDKYREAPDALRSLGELRQEIARAEAADELPD